MEKFSINITKRKDGRYMGKFIVGYDDNGKAQYHYVYGNTYYEAEKKLLIGREVASRYLSGRYITVGKVYEEWLNAVQNCVKESTFANYKAKFEKHILPEFCGIPCADLSASRLNEFINKKLAEGLSASYVIDIFTVFKSMLKYAQEEYSFKLYLICWIDYVQYLLNLIAIVWLVIIVNLNWKLHKKAWMIPYQLLHTELAPNYYLNNLFECCNSLKEVNRLLKENQSDRIKINNRIYGTIVDLTYNTSDKYDEIIHNAEELTDISFKQDFNRAIIQSNMVLAAAYLKRESIEDFKLAKEKALIAINYSIRFGIPSYMWQLYNNRRCAMDIGNSGNSKHITCRNVFGS
ncbi:MAG: N-terminal phage integrase SAM-like domain-containing protein [Clostridium sp.]|nr:N-terminal phage integrase SAM-like domain-containing protein [Clostridium sp.]